MATPTSSLRVWRSGPVIGHVKPQPPDVVSAEPRKIPPRVVWAAVFVLLLAGLAGTAAALVHYRGQVATLQRQLRTAEAAGPSLAVSSPAPQPVTIASAALLTSGPLAGMVTFVSADPPGGQPWFTVTAHVSGGRPHTRYVLAGGSCSGSGHRRLWAAGITNAHGSGDLRGPVWRSQTGQSWLELSPAAGHAHPSLAGDFAAASAITAYRTGPPMCGP